MFAYDKNLYILNHFAYVECDLLYSLYLRARNRLQGREPVTEEMVEKIREIGKEAFPEKLQEQRTFRNPAELAEYAYCSDLSQLEVHLTDNWYLVIADHHNCVDIVELADRRGKCPEILKILSYTMDRCGSRIIIAKCREITSFRLLRLLADRGRIEILEDKVTCSLGEEFHFLKFRVSRDYLKRQKENRRKTGRSRHSWNSRFLPRLPVRPVLMVDSKAVNSLAAGSLAADRKAGSSLGAGSKAESSLAASG